MPGDRGLARLRAQLGEGITLHPSIAPMLRDCAQRYGLQLPAPLAN
jgi:L-lactate dehydrogenase